MKIGILLTGHAPEQLAVHTGDYDRVFADFLAGYGFDFAAFNVVDQEFPDSITDCDGWLLTGSKHGAYEDHAFIPPLEEFIRAAYSADVPMVGICFGHQIIAQALGGTVEKFKDGWAVGRQTYEWGDETLALNAWHQDQVTQLPDGATPLASNHFCENAALVYDRRAFTVQPHPEFDSDFIAGLAQHRGRGNVPDALLDRAVADLPHPNDNTKLANMIARFFLERSLK